MADMSMGRQFTANPKRKFRWQIEIDGDDTTQHYVKTFARPNLDFDETELNYKHEKMWIAGKMTWGDISMTILDVAQENPAYDWINTVYNMSSGSFTMGFDGTGPGNAGDVYKKDVTLHLLNANGDPVETWTLYHCWPRSANFGDLDYSSSDACDIEVTLRFDRALRVL